ncbi:MAG: hypothetical protein MRERV_41c013 [Mycoplasmataceae bacterium RV_VA103A]|nr:MAG: hypothetical protein MRERV_41c013 [Mycoplasmataceae bacterium RV_VA103A]
MTRKYTIYFGGYTQPYYLREPRQVKGLLEDYVKDPDKLTNDLQDHNDQLDQLTKERDAAESRAKKHFNNNQILIKFIKEDLGFNEFTDGKAFLKGEKLPDIIKKLEKERNDARDAEKITQKTADKLQADLNKFIGLMNKWGVNDLIELNLLLEGWKNYPTLNNSVNNLLNKESVADIKELDQKINRPNTGLKATLQKNADDQDRYKQERDRERKKINDSKNAWDRLVISVNKKKTVIFGDLTKKKIRNNMSAIANQMGWTIPDPTIDSDEEVE